MEEQKKSGIPNVFEFFSKTIHAIQKLHVNYDNLIKTSQLFLTKFKTKHLYNKYLGRIPGLYKRYGDKASVKENELKGDPVKILLKNAFNYIHNITKAYEKAYEEFLKLKSEISKMDDPDTIKDMIIKNYKKNIPSRDKDGGKDFIPENNMKDTIMYIFKNKIAKALTQNGEYEPYGFTEESITLKDLPTAKHMINGLFEENAHEHPEEQTISSIFENEDSFKIMADQTKTICNEVVKLSQAVLNDKLNSKLFDDLKDTREKTYKSLGIKFGQSEDEAKKSKEEEIKRKKMDEIWAGMNYAADWLLKFKIYIFHCINEYFDKMRLIDELCFKCLEALLEVESKHLDTDYREGKISDTSKKNNDTKKDDHESDDEKRKEDADYIRKLKDVQKKHGMN